jgi:hypothetical protein
MKQAGIWLMVFGIGSVVLNFLGMEFKLLMWIDTWGMEIGWAIRAGLAVVGVALFFIGSRQESAKQPA